MSAKCFFFTLFFLAYSALLFIHQISPNIFNSEVWYSIILNIRETWDHSKWWIKSSFTFWKIDKFSFKLQILQELYEANTRYIIKNILCEKYILCVLTFFFWNTYICNVHQCCTCSSEMFSYISSEFGQCACVQYFN